MDQQLKDSYQIVENPQSSKKISLKNSFKTKSEILCVRFDPTDLNIAAGNLDGSLDIFPLQNGPKIHLNVYQEGKQAPCTAVRWRPPTSTNSVRSVIITGDGNGDIAQFHSTTGKELDRIHEQGNQILCLDYDRSGTYLASAGKDSIIRIYNDATKDLVYSLKGPGYSSDLSHQNRIFSVKFLQDDTNLLISSGWDQNVNLWDLRENKCVGSFIGGKLSGDSLDYKNNQILVGANSGKDQLKIFDYRERKLIYDIQYDKEKKENGAFIFGAQFQKNNDDAIAVCSSGRNELKLFDQKKNFEPIGTVQNFPKGVYSLDYANMSGKIAIGGGDGLLAIVQQLNKQAQ